VIGLAENLFTNQPLVDQHLGGALYLPGPDLRQGHAPMSNSSFKSLESKVDELIRLCGDMKKENQLLRDRENTWKHERDLLINRNQMARVRLEKVLRRLKSLEGDTL
jgi:cell division protein ZapB